MQNLKLLLGRGDRAGQERLLAALMVDRSYAEISVASTVGEFVSLLDRRRFDCAVMAFDLPADAAADLLGRMAARTAGPPVVVVADDDDPQQVIASFRQGAVDFVPMAQAFGPDGLWARVQAAAEDRRARRREQRKSERRRRQLSRLAETDPLTGLYNRRFLAQQLRGGAYRRDRRRTLSCVLMDVDHFKEVNDAYGHRAGDRVLRSLAREIRSDLAGGDTALRWGGEEFLILRPSTDLADAWIWAEDLRRRLARLTFRTSGKEFRVTVSMGVVSRPTGRMGYEMVDMADQALYLAKRSGRDRVCTHPMTRVDRALRQVEADGSASPLVRRRRFLHACKNLLGPTQTNHVTSHCAMVENVAAVLGKATGLSRAEILHVRMAGLIHDLGKCVIPESILAQTEPLTGRQWALIHRRSDFAAEMGRRLGFDRRTLTYVRQHARNAQAKAPRSVTLGARVVGVADAVVAMRSDRAYRPARRTEDVMAAVRSAVAAPVDLATVRSVCAAPLAAPAAV